MGEQEASIPDDFNLDAYLGNAWSVYRGDQSFEVELRFRADAAAVILEHRWHRTQKAINHDTGEVTLQFTVDGLNEIVRWIVGWAGQVTIVKPKELLERVLERHRKALAANGAKS